MPFQIFCTGFKSHRLIPQNARYDALGGCREVQKIPNYNRKKNKDRPRHLQRNTWEMNCITNVNDGFRHRLMHSCTAWELLCFSLRLLALVLQISELWYSIASNTKKPVHSLLSVSSEITRSPIGSRDPHVVHCKIPKYHHSRENSRKNRTS